VARRADLLAARLAADGWALEDDFQSASRVAELKDCAERRRVRGEFGGGRVGGPHREGRWPDVRGDFTAWLREPLFAAERQLLDDLEGLRLELNRQGMLGLFDLEMHYAWYPPGTGYARHVDRPHGRSQRVVSLVLYLNDSWRTSDGGELRLHGLRGRPVDVAPIGGRMVCFLTHEREHEVLPTHAARFSLSGWFRLRE